MVLRRFLGSQDPYRVLFTGLVDKRTQFPGSFTIVLCCVVLRYSGIYPKPDVLNPMWLLFSLDLGSYSSCSF